MKVSIKVLPTVLLDIKVDDDVVLWDFDVVDFMGVYLTKSGSNVCPSELRSPMVSGSLGRTVRQNVVEKGLGVVEGQ